MTICIDPPAVERARAMSLDRLVKEELLQKFCDSRLGAGASWATLNVDLIALRAWCTYMRQKAAYSAFMPAVPRKARSRDVEPRFIEPGHLEAIRAALPGDWRLAVAVLLGTGARAREILGARTKQVSFSGARFWVNDAKSEGKQRWVHVPAFAATALGQLHREAVAEKRVYLMPPSILTPPVSDTPAEWDACCKRVVKAAYVAWAAAQVQAGYHDHGAAWKTRHVDKASSRAARVPHKPALVRHYRPDYRLHDLRHTCATLMVVGGWNVEEVRKRLGHEGLGTTQRYTNAAAELRDAPGVQEYADTHYAPRPAPNRCPTVSPTEGARG